ncbi:FtsW/RodA/SpoVE family cell cycle protein [Heliobacterium undosum]|uniref:FtsW/RodA/SpoVE family cell cycle protein n=1 Tax=Heliomicrobium undosum TaxID=121734 RepID=A0A845L7M5_9FIRM|nr:FtsW/RodA/SpoVE family cell cycle protein [Heliomicrobium undosum]MZP31045.1 FtsW/RodA/SpoVE family cell cycle protein [Heliomicrobium undosum]
MMLEKHAGVAAYLDAVCAHIRCREVHEQIRMEFLSHIEAVVEEEVAGGQSEQAAIEKALRQMGDAAVVGRQLHKAHRPRTEWGLVALVSLILGIGLLTLHSIQAQGLLENFTAVLPFQRTLVWLFIGLAAAVGLYFYDYRKLRKRSAFLYGAVVMVLTTLHFTGTGYYGKMYLILGPFQIDFSGISPYLLTVALAGLFCQWKWDAVGFGKALGLLTLPLALYFFNRDEGSFLLYLVAFLVLMALSGARRSQWVSFIAGIGAFAGFVIFSDPRYPQVFFSFLNPAADPQGAGWLHVRLQETIATAGWWGHGFTFSALWLPEIHTDFIFPYMLYTFGWAFGALLLTAVMLLIYRMVSAARMIKDPFGRHLILGFTGLIGFALLWNILCGSGLTPGIYISLPFISYGGSQLLINLAATGLVLSVFRRKDLIRVDEMNPKKN